MSSSDIFHDSFQDKPESPTPLIVTESSTNNDEKDEKKKENVEEESKRNRNKMKTARFKSESDIINDDSIEVRDYRRGYSEGSHHQLRHSSYQPYTRQMSIVALGIRNVGTQVKTPIRKLERKARSEHLLMKLKSKSAMNLGGSGKGGGVVLGETTPLKAKGDNDDGDDDNGDEEGGEGMGEEMFKVGPIMLLRDLIFGKPLNVLMLFIPLGWWSHYFQWKAVYIFWLNFTAMIPLASLLGDFTEDVAAHTNQVIGGLINASFGNAVEVVVAIQALLANEIRVVQSSMIGSIFSNLLLVLGGCFFFGGLKYDEQSFNSTAATANMSLLALSSIALVLPTPFANYYEIEDEHVLHVSRYAAVFLMLMYLQLLIFQLRTHKHLFEDLDDGDEVASLPFWLGLLGLVVVTVIIAVLSEYLVQSIDGFVTDSGISRTFVGLIILPIVGNAVEHITAINVAMKDKMDLAMGVAVGSCTQISLFVIPITVIFGWILDRNMTLNFPPFEITLFILSVVTVSICISNPRGNWLEGSLLMTTYFMVALGFWYEEVKDY